MIWSKITEFSPLEIIKYIPSYNQTESLETLYDVVSYDKSNLLINLFEGEIVIVSAVHDVTVPPNINCPNI